MQKERLKGKKDFSTRLVYEREKRCRTLRIGAIQGQAPPKIDGIRCQRMPKHLFAFSVVTLATSSMDIPLISAICSAISGM